jgi:hypothetical protein
MPITILDYVKSVAGEKDFYPAEDFYRAGVNIAGGCERCTAIIAAYNAYPSTSGYWRCADCIGTSGFTTLEEFQESLAETEITCPRCGGVTDIHEVQVTNERTEALEYVFECGECGLWWP